MAARRPLLTLAALATLVTGLVLAVASPVSAIASRSKVVSGLTAGPQIVVGSDCVFVMDRVMPSRIVAIDRDTMAIVSTVADVRSLLRPLVIGNTLFVVTDWDTVSRFTYLSDCSAPTRADFTAADVTFSAMARVGSKLWLVGDRVDAILGSVPVMTRFDATTGAMTQYDRDHGGWVASSTGASDRLWTPFGVWDVSGAPTKIVAGVIPSGYPGIVDASAASVFTWDPSVPPLSRFDADTLAQDPSLSVSYAGESQWAADPVHPEVTGAMWGDYTSALRLVTLAADGQVLLDQTFRFGLEATQVPRALAFAPAGDQLYLVVAGVKSDTIEIIELPSQIRTSAISIDAPATIKYGRTLRVDVHVTPPGAVVKLFAKEAGRTKRIVASGATDVDGLLTYTMTADRNVTFTAVFKGDATHQRATAKANVGVEALLRTRLFRSYGTKDGYRLVHPGTDPIYAITVTPAMGDDVVEVRLYRDGGHMITTRTFPLDAEGRVAIVVNGLRDGKKYLLVTRFVSPEHSETWSRDTRIWVR